MSKRSKNLMVVDDQPSADEHAAVIENLLRSAKSITDWIDVRQRVRGTGVKYHPTDRDRMLVLWHVWSGTPQADLAQMMGMSLETLRSHFHQELDLGLKGLLADLTKTLIARAMSGDTTALIFALKARGGEAWRDKAPAINVNVAQDATQAERVAADPEKVAKALDAVAERVLARIGKKADQS